MCLVESISSFAGFGGGSGPSRTGGTVAVFVTEGSVAVVSGLPSGDERETGRARSMLCGGCGSTVVFTRFR